MSLLPQAQSSSPSSWVCNVIVSPPGIMSHSRKTNHQQKQNYTCLIRKVKAYPEYMYSQKKSVEDSVARTGSHGDSLTKGRIENRIVIIDFDQS